MLLRPPLSKPAFSCSPCAPGTSQPAASFAMVPSVWHTFVRNQNNNCASSLLQFCNCIRWIHRDFSQHEVCLLIGNDQVVSTLQKCQASEPSPFKDDTWTVAVHSALRLISNPLQVLWIKGHANFIGEKNQRQFLKMGSSQPDFPPPPRGSVAIHHLPVLHKFKTQQICHLLSQHSHNNIAVGPSFSLYNKASWFRPCLSKLRPSATTCTAISGATCFTTTSTQGADSIIPWTPCPARLSAKH